MDVRIDELLAESQWLRRLALSLVGDASAADDLVQETYVAALQHPPDADRPVRPWLRAVLRNAAWMRVRADGRRTQRELATEVTTESPARPDAAVARLEVQRRLADLVLGLDEPTRTAVVLRYVEGLSAADVARRVGEPAGTVRWRIKRGLDELRDALDRDAGGERVAWQLALAPATSVPMTVAGASGTGVVGGLLAMKTLAKVGVVIAAIAGVGAGAMWWTGDDEPAAKAAAAPHDAAAESAVAPAPTGDVASRVATAAEQRPAVRKHDSAARARLAEAIRAARERRVASARPAAKPAGERGTAPMLGDGDLDKEYIRDAIRELLPMIKECYVVGLERDPDLSGKLVVSFTISGEPEVGGIVADSAIDPEESTLVDDYVHECVRETMYGAELPAPKDGGIVTVRYPFEFRNDPDE